MAKDLYLKPCPFCGGEAYVEEREASDGEFVFVKCSLCSACAESFYISSWCVTNDENYLTKAEKRAVSAWNKRASDSATEKEGKEA